MAKKTAAKKPAEKQPDPKPDFIDPQRIHELFGVPGPYEPKEVPIPTKNYVTFWDVGMSINEMRRRKKELFSFPATFESQRFAKDSDSWKWRQICLTPFGVGEPFDGKTRLQNGSDLPLARELVCYLVLMVLATGERIEIPRLRCRDTLPSGRRVCVGPWYDSGLEIANVADAWKSPGMGCCSLYTPIIPRKK